MHRNGNFSVFKRLFIIYSLLVVLIYLVLVGLFQNYINQTTEELVSSKRIQASSFLGNLEQQFDTIYRHEVNLANSANVTKLAYYIYTDAYEKSQIILNLLSDIEGIQAMSPLIEDIVITYPAQQILLSAASGYEKDPDRSWSAEGGSAAYDYLQTTDGKVVMNFSFPLQSSVSDDYIPDFNIQILLSEDLLRESLGTFNDERGSGAAIRFSLEEEILVEDDEDAVVKQYYADQVTGGDIRDDYQFVSADSEKYPLSVVVFIDRQVIREIRLRYLIMLTVVMLVLTALYAGSLVYTKFIVVKPLRELMHAFDRIQGGDFDVRIYHEPHDEFNYLYRGFNSSVAYIEKLIADIYEQENLLQNAELAQLQSQINPHFLYNSFFIINRMAKNESYELITKFVTSLAKYYRFINKETSHFITLAEEVEHMTNYVDIQQMRFGEKITVEQEVLPEGIRTVFVPKLILQPLIENAYSYGLADTLEGGLIRISYTLEQARVEISVEDNGSAAGDDLIESMKRNLRDNSDGGNHALHNIHKRLRLAYGSRCGVSVTRSELGGVKVTLTLDKDVPLP